MATGSTDQQQSAPVGTQPGGTRPPAPKEGKRWLRWSAGILTGVVVLAGVTGMVALQTDWGSKMVWKGATRLLAGQLSGDIVGGTLSHGLTVQNVEYRTAGQVIRIDRLESAWNMYRAPWSLDIRFLRLGNVDVTLLPTPPEPRVLPQAITLPLAIDLQSATIRKVTVHQDAASSEYTDIRLRARSDGTQHAVTLEQAVTPFGTADAALRLNGVRPFALGGTANLKGVRQDNRYELATRLSGSLELLGIEVNASDSRLSGNAVINAMPFAAVPLRDAQVLVRHLDPQVFNPAWPRADLEIRATLAPLGPVQTDLSKMRVAGPVSITNAVPGAIDKQLLPLVSAKAEVVLDAQEQKLSAVRLSLPGGAVLQGQGEMRGTAGGVVLDATGLNLQTLYSTLRTTALKGPLSVRLAGDTQHVEIDLADAAMSAKATAELGPKQIALKSARLQAGAAELAVTGTLGRDEQANYLASGKLTNFNPAAFMAMMPAANGKKGGAAVSQNLNARINTTFEARGMLRPELTADVGFKVYDSMYADLPMTGAGTLRLAGQRLLPSDVQLSIAGNDLRLKGSFGGPADRLAVDLNAPALGRLGFGLAGLAQVNGVVSGTFQRPTADVTYRAEKLVFGAHRVDALSGKAQTQGVPGQTPNARVAVTVDARGVKSGDVALSTLNAVLDGTYASHTLRLDSAGRLRGKPLALKLAAQGRLVDRAGALAWTGTLRTLENNGLPRVRLESPLAVSAAPGRIELGGARMSVAQATIELKNFQLNNGAIRSEGSMRGINVGELLALREQFTGERPPVETNLIFDGDWKVALAGTATGTVRLTRRSGDVRVAETALGLSNLALRADLQGTEMKLGAEVAGTRIGTVNGQGRIGLQQVDGGLTITPQSSVSGRVTAALPRLQSLGILAGPGIAFDGSAAADVTISGLLANPKLAGTISGDNLALTLYDQGIRLKDGIARINVIDNVLELRQMQFRGGDGTIRATGRIALDQGNQGLTATVVADRLQLLTGPSGQLTVSGQAKAANVDSRLLVTGKFTVDRAVFSLPEQTAPQLDGDVVVIRGGKAPPRVVAATENGGPAVKPAGAYTPEVNVEIDLGPQFYFKGSGADLRLVGALRVQSAPNNAPQAFGTIRVAEGTYEAFGTKLAIERGIINFQGPLKNPNINLLAMRRQPEVAAGVQVTGDAQRPRVELVSEPALSQEEKLSWLVFGHGSSNGTGAGGAGQAQTAVKGAAFGLLNKFGGKNVAKSVGLDALAIGNSEYGLGTSQVVNLGKQISDKVSIGYEQSLASAGSVLKLTYALSQYWSVVLRGGTVTGLDVLYNRRFDTLRSKEAATRVSKNESVVNPTATTKEPLAIPRQAGTAR